MPSFRPGNELRVVSGRVRCGECGSLGSLSDLLELFLVEVQSASLLLRSLPALDRVIVFLTARSSAMSSRILFLGSSLVAVFLVTPVYLPLGQEDTFERELLVGLARYLFDWLAGLWRLSRWHKFGRISLHVE